MKNYFTLLLLVLFCVQLSAQVYLDIEVIPAQDTIEANIDNPIFTILDVRTAGEYLPEHIEGAFNRDYYAEDFSQQLDSLDKSRTYLIYCQSGGRSGATLTLMEDLGFDRVYNILGGMGAWNNAGLPVTDVIPEYINIYAATSSTTNLDGVNINVSPNPFSEILNIEFDEFPSSFIGILYTINGIEVFESDLQQSNKFELANLSAGIYFFSIKSNGKIISTYQVVKE